MKRILLLSVMLFTGLAYGRDPFMARRLAVWDGVGVGGELWTPADLGTNLVIWLDASDASTVQTTGGTVTNWLDKSASGINAYAQTLTRAPAYTNTLNGLNILTFDGAGIATDASRLVIDIADFTISQPFHSFAVTQLDNTDTQVAVDSLSNNRCYFSSRESGDFTTHAGTTTPASYGAFDASYNIHSVFFNSVSSVGYINGTGTVISVGGNGYEGMSIGNIRGNPNPLINNYALQGNIPEILVVKPEPSQADRQRVEGYLAHKWGLTANLPSDHPYKNAAPTK